MISQGVYVLIVVFSIYSNSPAPVRVGNYFTNGSCELAFSRLKEEWLKSKDHGYVTPSLWHICVHADE